MNNFNCISNLLTVTDLDKFKLELSQFKSLIFTSRNISQESINLILTEQNARNFILDLEEIKIDIKTKEILIKFIEDILINLEQIKKVVLVFPIIPTLSMLNKIQELVQGHGKFVYEYKLDPSIYAGVVIMIDGLVYDYSIKSKVEKELY